MAATSKKDSGGRRKRRTRAELAKSSDNEGADAIKLTRHQVAYALQIAPLTFQENYRQYVPDEYIDKQSRVHQYDLRTFGAVMKGATKAVAASYTEEEKDKKESSLDRKREIQAKAAQLDYEIKRGSYLSKDQVVDSLDRFVSTMRRYGDKFRTTGDAHVVEMFNEMIEEAADAAKVACEQMQETSEEETAWVA